MPPDFVFHIKTPRVGVLEPLHAVHEVRPRGLEHKMVVIIHEREGMDKNRGASRHLTQSVQEHPAVVITLNNVLPTIPPCHDMVDGSGVLDAWCSGHKGRLDEED